MMLLAGYKIGTLIYESANTLVYRGQRESDNLSVILKILKRDYPVPAELSRYKQEYDILRNLNLEGVIKVYGLQESQNTLILIVEDFSGESLEKLMESRRFTLQEFLSIAIKLTESLGSVHAANIIHKDINPSNIVYNAETRQVKLIDFGISTVLTRENPTIKNPNILEGTLAYISPEQTGRMNRALDYRTDFYSLGVTFYELLTNCLPCEAADAMELVHCHIAIEPVPPHQISSEIPNAVSNIVMKLLAKTAEERYQSAWGIKADLEECLNQLQSRGEIKDFSLASKDISDKFQIPQKLYGRERDVEILMAAFDRIGVQGCASGRGRSEIMLVSGYAGIGKTSLVQVLYKPITRQHGYFISGKFDQFQRNSPYSAVIKAFQELVGQLLTETESKLNQWREKIEAALGANGQLIIDVIPEVELIVGNQPSVPKLPPAEAQNRFMLVFQNFIRVFTKPEQPLVIFLDDLQWADGASLNLVQLLITASDSQYLFLIGAYRDNEVSAAHPLMLTLEEIYKFGAIVNTISLSPLTFGDIKQLISDTLNCSVDRATPLAELVLKKTNGNPFFMNEFLKSLYVEKLLQFDYQQGAWQWNLEHIQARGITDNVVALLASKIQKLNSDTQQVLQLAAAIGNQFDLSTLAYVLEKSPEETAGLLREGMSEGLVLPVDSGYKATDKSLNLIQNPKFKIQNEASLSCQFPISNLQFPISYKFAHDRIQQAAYSLIPEADKPTVHWQLGQLLLRSIPLEKRERKIFSLVNQLNFGIELITSQKERDELAQLNLIAAKKAKASAAYEPAFKYLQVGIRLLGDDSWLRHYDLTLALYVEAAEAAYLTGDFEQMERFAQSVMQKARSLLDKVKVYEVKIYACGAQNRLIDAVNTGLEVLKELGVTFPEQPNKLQVFLGLLRTKLTLVGKQIDALIDLPQMTDPYKLAAIRILATIATAAYFAVPALYPLIVFKTINLSVKSGNATESAIGYAAYGLILCGVLGEIESGYQFGQLALRLLERFNAQERKAKIMHVVYNFIIHWKESVRSTLNPLREAYKIGLETGDLEYAAYALHVYVVKMYLIGQELTELEREIAATSDAIIKIKQVTPLNFNEIFHQAILNLMGQAENPCRLIGERYDEEKKLPLHLAANDRTATCDLYFNKLILCYFFGQYGLAIENATKAETYIDGLKGSAVVPVFYFYDSLARLAVLPTGETSQQRSLLKKVETNQKKFKKWAYHAPMNYLQRLYLVEAERHRVVGQERTAMDLYDQAIALAKVQEYIQEEALANELAAKFYLALGKFTIAQVYMQNARYCYLKWGATRKVKDLDERYPQLLKIISEDTTSEVFHKKTPTFSSVTGSGKALDLTTVIKASQTISGEIKLDKLLASLMKILLENAGARKGFLILAREGKLLIEASASVEKEDIDVLQSISVEGAENLPLSVIHYVERTCCDVVLNDAANKGQFTSDPYIAEQKLKSILCTPILNQGRLIGILYLENNLMAGAFTSDRLEVLRLLSSQAAISLENALLYANLENKVEERTAQLQERNQELQELNKLKDVFLQAVSHDLRNPVTGMLMVLKNLLSKSSPVVGAGLTEISAFPPINSINPPVQESRGKETRDILVSQSVLERMIQSSDRQLKLINSLLEVHAAQEQGVVVDCKPIQLSQLVRAIVAEMEPILAKNQATLTNQVSDDLPMVSADKTQLWRVFENLIANALKHNPPGVSISVCATVEQENTELKMVRCAIADNGAGIDQAQCDRLFELYYRGGNSRNLTGFGLGLYLCRQIIKAHGGEIGVISSPGTGTTFWFTLPIANN